ncbi:MAG: hypothetical protein HZA27_03230 [Candidatus Omnitrophica bacterium]|nr:hypothetical protein [Candidatus Omnitrophota bacterium]
MQNKLEKLIKLVYRKHKADAVQLDLPHPSEEDFACFLEGKLSPPEQKQMKLHLLRCGRCMDILATITQLEPAEEKPVPQELIAQAKGLLGQEGKISLLEILLRLKENILELVNTTGDVLVGQELVPAPVLRSRQIKDFKDTVTILKDFKDIRVEVKVENKVGGAFSLAVLVKEKSTSKIIKDLRVTLLKDDVELESYVADSGKAVFEHVELGKYRIEIENLQQKIASVLLEIKA